MKIGIIAPTPEETKYAMEVIVVDMEEYPPMSYNSGNFQYEEYEYVAVDISKHRGARFDQIVLFNRLKLPQVTWYDIFSMLSDSCVPVEYQIIKLEI